MQHEAHGQHEPSALASAAAPLLPAEEGAPSPAPHTAADPTPRPSALHAAAAAHAAATAAVGGAESEHVAPPYAAAGVAQRSSHAAPSHDY